MPEGGSGTIINDLTFNGGAVGLNIGSPQYHVKSAIFIGCETAIKITYCYACTFQNISFEGVSIGIDMTSPAAGSVTLIDSRANNLGVLVAAVEESTGDHSLVIDNYIAGSNVFLVRYSATLSRRYVNSES